MLSTTQTEIASAAIATGLVQLPPHHDAEVTQCNTPECGLLLVRLERPVLVTRAHVVRFPFPGLGTRTVTTPYRMRYAHLARPDGLAACPACFEDPARCTEDHTAFMCDVPDFVPCRCGDPVVPGQFFCPSCLPPEEDQEPTIP